MTATALEDQVAGLFDEFVDAFATFDGRSVGGLFVTPGVALTRDGTLHGFQAQPDIERYYQAVLDRYRETGCIACRYRDLETVPLNPATLVATATWDLLRGDGSVMSSWRQAYFLTLAGGDLRIFGSAFVSA